MSVQFGRWNFDGMSAAADYTEKVKTLLLPFGPDEAGNFAKSGIVLLYRSFHTTKESRKETQPHILASGEVLTWDGRLDNRRQLVDELHGECSLEHPDIAIVASAYARWRTGCFVRLLGDWALAIWNPEQHQLILAKDFVGTRHLYYRIERDHVAWSSIIDPLIPLTQEKLKLDEEYIAGWLSLYPAAHLTPYAGIHAVPPASFVTVTPGKHAISSYWSFDGSKQIRYRTDDEYEEHFRTLFAESVRRRLRSDAPVLAELSGGMDSSSIVCIADRVSETCHVDTVSYYDDFEPNWNERPYFEKVEELRGRTGLHLDANTHPSHAVEEIDHISFWPGTNGGAPPTELVDWMQSHGHRVILSGMGGDEVMGGVPTPIPELGDLLVQAQFKTLAHRLKAWALIQRRPWFQLLGEVASPFFPPTLFLVPKHRGPAPWFAENFVARHRRAFLNYERRRTVFGPLPTFQENLAALDGLRRQMACSHLRPQCLAEKRYPFLDRDLLSFLYAIPREQLVRPGQRRSLMRRALAGIVPDEILHRRRKAFIARSPFAQISRRYKDLVDRSGHMISSSLGFVDAAAFVDVLGKAHSGQEVPMIPLLRTLAMERWLQSLQVSDRLDHFSDRAPSPFLYLESTNEHGFFAQQSSLTHPVT